MFATLSSVHVESVFPSECHFRIKNCFYRYLSNCHRSSFFFFFLKKIVMLLISREEIVRTQSTHPWQARRCSNKGSPRSGCADEAAVSSDTLVFPQASARALPARLQCPVAFAGRPDPPSPIICGGNRKSFVRYNQSNRFKFCIWNTQGVQ